ncbi:MAG: DUF308 domain-containing protein [Verrucomicrobia bacterium]|nr:DUF308 domain-containing protein [Verrucomicrobiota bacterium]MBU4248329.1 DUF308 domain-containing protein [Verrucomicrobiota bacterium]MBU4291838.1 DUF308 domain-containing protein [Verrucomicrobiota bacterium]MBU4496667.1 DUF308 domain-containing protein [Verrucomicrobiota bacterium]MCG2680572.1 DUF308 domain-containing protein [Kiritimatiellia bacterium]
MNGEVIGIRNWWSLALRGIVAVLFGLAVFIWPGITIEALVILFGAFAFLGGVFSIFSAIKTHSGWILILQGILGILIGLAALFFPLSVAVTLLALIAVWAVITGGLELVMALRLHQVGAGRWLLVLNGLLSLLFGVLLVIWPFTGMLVIVALIGAYAIMNGILLFGLACHLHGLQKHA